MTRPEFIAIAESFKIARPEQEFFMFRMGDLLVFSMFTVHASLDNQTNRIRLSSDTRYQRAADPVDERWIGENPVGHGPGGKRAMIC